MCPCGLLFLPETHSSGKVEQEWKEDFHDQVFFSHRKTSSWGVLTVYLGSDTSRRNLGAMFSAGALVYFSQYQQNFIDLYYFAHSFLTTSF